MSVEQGTLRVGAQQRMMGVLAMDVGKEFGRFAQLAKRGRRAVDISTRAAAAIDQAAQQAGVRAVRLEIVGLEPGDQRRVLGKFEFGRHLGAFATDAHHPGFSALPQSQRERIDGAAGSGDLLIGHDVPTAREIDDGALRHVELCSAERDLFFRELLPGCAKDLIARRGRAAAVGVIPIREIDRTSQQNLLRCGMH